MAEATARANANIAFIKYWGNVDNSLRLPANASLSMNLDGLYTETTVRWSSDLASDSLVLNGESVTSERLERVSKHLDVIRERLGSSQFAEVHSTNNFPMGAGIASSAAAFAALTLAAVHAGGAEPNERELTTLARQGSGSAARSVPSGYVIWHMGADSAASYAESIAGPEHWELVDVIAIVSQEHKAVGSGKGHTSADTSDLQAARVAGAGERLDLVRKAILSHDFETLTSVVEHDSNLMHAVMMTSRPPLFYWQPATLTVINAVRAMRDDGLDVCYTLDAGPNVHCICLPESAEAVKARLHALPGVADVMTAHPGPGARLVED